MDKKGIINIPLDGDTLQLEFEWDSEKSLKNADKHGLGFEKALILWFDLDLLTVPVERGDERRFLATGRLMGKVWTAVFTWRGGRIRLISVRRARDEEEKRYNDQQ